MDRTLTLGFSPCPNDTFIFDAIVNRRIDCRGFKFDIVVADVEELNSLALSNSLDITKLSYGVYPKVAERYQILNSGSALGFGNGPIVVSRHRAYPDELESMTVAIPGENTTANLLLKKAFPNIEVKRNYLFSDIEEVVLSGECDAGVLIHEGRFTYADRGLSKVVDLGELYEERYNLPIPLGGIVMDRSIEHSRVVEFDKLLQESVKFAFENPEASYEYIKSNAQETKESVIRQHIALYVNQFSMNLGDVGREAITSLLEDSLPKELSPFIYK